MVILHVAPLDWRRISGLNAIVPRLCHTLNGFPSVQAAILSSFHFRGSPPELSGLPIFRSTFPPWHTLDTLPKPFDRPDVVEFNSTYIWRHLFWAIQLRHRGIPYILTPHGGMTRAAQKSRSWKKIPANRIAFDRYVDGARAIRCVTRRESDETRGWISPKFIAGSGVDLPPAPRSGRIRSRGHLQVTFIGRLDVRAKGLDILLDAITLVHQQLRDRRVRVHLYGPDQRGSAGRLRRLISSRGLGDVVECRPSLSGAARDEILRDSDVFVHTSRFEGQPTAILEALSHGVPCLVTPGTNLADHTVEHEMGWAAAGDAGSVAEALRRIADIDDGAWTRASRNARAYSEDHLAWRASAERFLDRVRRFIA